MSALSPEVIQALLNGPGLAPPPGEVPNLKDPPNERTTMIVVNTVYLVLTTVAIFIRMYTKGFIARRVEVEDYVSFLGWIMFVSFSGLGIYTFGYGVGVHQWNVALHDVFSILYYFYILEVLYGPILFVIKISILLQYRKIFVPNKRKNGLYIAIYVVIFVVLVFYTVETLVLLFGCTPREKVWNKLLTTGHCVDYNGVFLSAGIFNVASDFIILLLPQPTIWKLNIPLGTKVGLSITFAMGFVACLISILRIYYTVIVIRTHDTTYNFANFAYAAEAEMVVGIVCSCVPVFPRFFRTVMPKVYTVLRIHTRGGTTLDNSAGHRLGSIELGSNPTKNTWGDQTWKSSHTHTNNFITQDDSVEHLRGPTEYRNEGYAV